MNTEKESQKLQQKAEIRYVKAKKEYEEASKNVELLKDEMVEKMKQRFEATNESLIELQQKAMEKIENFKASDDTSAEKLRSELNSILDNAQKKIRKCQDDVAKTGKMKIIDKASSIAMIVLVVLCVAEMLISMYKFEPPYSVLIGFGCLIVIQCVFIIEEVTFLRKKIGLLEDFIYKLDK